MKEFFAFVRHPSRLMLHTPTAKASIVRLLLWMLLLHLAAIVLYFFVGKLLTQLGSYTPSSSISFDEAILIRICKTALLAPLLEESGFRLGLSFKRRHAVLMLGMCVYLCSLPFVNISWYIDRIIGLSAGLLIGLPFYLRVKQPQLDRLKQGYAGRTVYLFSMLFALMHLSNYSPLCWAAIPFYSITILYMFFAGLQLSYIRVRLGFWYGCLLHALFNLIPVTAYFIAQYIIFSQ